MEIPAGITDSNIEAFSFEDKVMIIKEGQILDLTDSTDALTIFRELLDSDLEALLRIERRTTDPVKQIEEFIRCRFGAFDDRADITADGICLPEYWNCPKRGTCQDEGVVCTLPGGPNGRLTPQEIRIIKLIAEGLADKEIAARLCISECTVHTHRRSIEFKLCLPCKAAVAVFAIKNNIV